MKVRILASGMFFFLASLTAMAAERNIIYFITDDQSPTLGCYGDPVAISPHVDAVAQDGTRFLNAFATTASCSPSRSVILSGMHNHANGQYGLAHDVHHFASLEKIKPLTLPVALAAAGYRTGHIGKLHVLPESAYHFETYLKGNARNPLALVENCKEFITAEKDKPFFLYIGTADPHRSGTNLESSPLQFKPDLFGNPPGGKGPSALGEIVFAPQKVPVPEFLPDTPECRAELAQYYQSCARVDRGFGRLIEILKEAGVYDQTLIIFTSDHGIAMPGAKTTTYDPGLHVPFIVRNPYESRRGIISDAMISHVDLAPTLLEFAGALKPETLLSAQSQETPKAVRGPQARKPCYHGKSWLTILGEPSPSGWDRIYASHTFHEVQMYYPMRVIRDRNHKFIWNIASELSFPFAADLWESATWQGQLHRDPNARYGKKSVTQYTQRPKYELYDLKNDPLELTNLAELPEYAGKVKEFEEQLRTFQLQTADPWAVKWTHE